MSNVHVCVSSGKSSIIFPSSAGLTITSQISVSARAAFTYTLYGNSTGMSILHNIIEYIHKIVILVRKTDV